MIYFHQCKEYQRVVIPEVNTSILDFINTYKNNTNLKGIGKVTAFTKGIYILRIKNPFSETILEERNITVNDEKLLVYFIRGYKNGLGDYVSIRDGKWLLNNPLPDYEIEAFKNKYNNDKVKTKTISKPPQNLLNWQSDYKLRVDYDIFEAASWVKFAISTSHNNGMRSIDSKIYLLTIKNIVNDNETFRESIKKENNFEIFQTEYHDIGIIYAKIALNDKTYFLLLNGANIQTQKTNWEIIKKSNFDYLTVFNEYKDICRQSLKAYPKWTLNDAELWVKIEKNNELGNLSLLPEQTEFLKDFQFPKYINGQAGSGKSTMLYYLFSNVYYYKCAGEITGDIIFLTENEKLLEHTKTAVYDLLINNPQFDLSSEPEAIVDIDKHFHPFKNFLLDMIPEGNEDFQADHYLDFSKFKSLYKNSNLPDFIKFKYSAELVWFTISTYVHGNNLNFQITSENYDEKMPKEGKDLISKEDLKGMEDGIINPFYNKLIIDEKYWDKIKLIKYITDGVFINKTYDVIFCDEAQDFSKVELEFIMSLSTYKQYDLSNVAQFPIVFAGDALQTVNPTGFRSAVLTSMIYKELTNIETGYKLNPDNLVFTPTYNYRSSQSIVNVANAIQNFRKEALNADVQSPQFSKRPVINQHEHLNVFVNFDAFTENIDLQNKIEYKTIIVPVNRDEIIQFKDQYPILKRFKNIISPVDAKGLDFNEVVIFGFGEYILNKISASRIYEKRFFYNKLYVAVTRAQAELVIIDSEISKENFWRDLIKKYINSDWAKEVATDLVNFEDLIIFDTNEIIESSETILKSDAYRQKNQGVIEKNTSLLQVASSHFIKLGNKKEYFLCLAEVEKIKENWEKAALFYLKPDIGSEGIEQALNCYWNGKNWDDLLKISINVPSEITKVRTLVAKLLLNNSLTHSDLKNLYEKSNILRKQLQFVNWRKEFTIKITNFLNSLFEKEEIILVCDILEEISMKDDSSLLEIIAEKYYEIGKYKYAANILENNGIENGLYLKVKLEIAKLKNDIEETIVYMGRITIETDCDKIKNSEELLEVYFHNEEHVNNLTNIYVSLYVLTSLLVIKSNNSKVLNITQKVEKWFNEKNRSLELSEVYFNLLKDGLIGIDIYNYILERWVKNSYEAGSSIDSINEEYKKLINSTSHLYIPFSEKEVINIDLIPSKLKNMTPDHFYNIEIQNFRKFQKVKIENLGLINLIVGDNNIGKTSLLEALLFTSNKKEYLERLAFAYIERTNLHPDKKESSKNINYYYNLIPDFLTEYKNCNNINDKTIFRISDKRELWNYEFTYFSSDKTINQYFNDSYLKSLEYIPYENGTKLPYIPYAKGYSVDLSIIYDSEIRPKKELEKEFLNHLRIFIPNVQNIYIKTDGNIDIRDDDYSEDRPLSQYGEGANKLFRILILLTLHKGKRLLIDEIDAGIHFSRFKQFWRILLKIALKDNTQIIVTTHNDECIKFFNEVLNEKEFGEIYQEVSRVVQMKKTNKIKIRSLEYNSFNLAFEDGVEIRGGANKYE